MKKTFVILFILLTGITSCETESPYSGYSAFFTCDIYLQPLMNQITSFGRFVTVRPTTNRLGYTITDMDGNTHEYQLSEMEARQNFQYGLGGFIIGTPAACDNEIWVYDWACPNCNQQKHRLGIDNTGIAVCHKCGAKFDLNSGGIPIEGESRTLWRYKSFLTGSYLTVQN